MSSTQKPRTMSMFNLAYDRGREKKKIDLMEAEHKKEKPRSIFKKLASSSKGIAMFTKTKSWSAKDQKPTSKQLVAPSGCFSVYVGQEKHRFVIKTEFANHPSFKMLLDEAEMEYGFSSEGPLLLPCEVDLFCRILAEIDCEKIFEDKSSIYSFGYGSCSLFKPARRLTKGCRSYTLLTPYRLLKMNHV